MIAGTAGTTVWLGALAAIQLRGPHHAVRVVRKREPSS
jgi:hypothetical protein